MTLQQMEKVWWSQCCDYKHTSFHNLSCDRNKSITQHKEFQDRNKQTKPQWVSQEDHDVRRRLMWWGWAPSLKPTAMRKQSHRHQQGLPGGKNTLFKVHVQGHDDKSRGLVGTRTVLAKTQRCFVERLQVSMAENVHLTKTHERNKCHPVFAHFMMKRCGEDTKKCGCHRPSRRLRRGCESTLVALPACILKTSMLKDRTLCLLFWWISGGYAVESSYCAKLNQSFCMCDLIAFLLLYCQKMNGSTWANV